MITCSRCGKENQDHYKFCLGCGEDISAESGGHCQESFGIMRNPPAPIGLEEDPPEAPSGKVLTIPFQKP